MVCDEKIIAGLIEKLKMASGSFSLLQNLVSGTAARWFGGSNGTRVSSLTLVWVVRHVEVAVDRCHHPLHLLLLTLA